MIKTIRAYQIILRFAGALGESGNELLRVLGGLQKSHNECMGMFPDYRSSRSGHVA